MVETQAAEAQPTVGTEPCEVETYDTSVSSFLREVKWLDEEIRSSPRLQSLVDAFWREMWGGEGRELGNPYREYFKTCPEDLGLWIRENEEAGRPSYISVNTYSDRDRVSRISELFFELDGKEDPPDLHKVWLETRSFAEALEAHYGVKPLIVFSGRRGFHVHLLLKEPVGWGLSQDHLSQLYRELSGMILRGVGLKTLDPSPVGDVKRLARLPYTIHEGSGLLCVPVDDKLHPVLLMPGWSRSYREHGLGEGVVELAVKRVNERILSQALKPKRPVRHAGSVDKSLRGVRPCIPEALRRPLHGGNGHLMRLGILREYQALGWSPEEIAKQFETQEDYEPSKTLRIVEENWNSFKGRFSCETIRRLGFCLAQDCPTKIATDFGRTKTVAQSDVYERGRLVEEEAGP